MRPSYRPHSPPEVPHAIADIIRGRVVCDMGCGYGDTMVRMLRYAKHVVGIEHDKEKFEFALNRNLDVHFGDFTKQVVEADVYYQWSVPEIHGPMTAPPLLERGKVAIYLGETKSQVGAVTGLVGAYNGEFREVPFVDGAHQCKMIVGILGHDPTLRASGQAQDT